jgi:hypothetical protein
MKIRRKPVPKGRPERVGTIQWIEGLAVQPSQKREMAKRGAPRPVLGSSC